MKSFSDLLMLHQQLDELFFEHQRALIRGDLDTALGRLEAYESELLDHIWDGRSTAGNRDSQSQDYSSAVGPGRLN
jgi:hypothetical protein